MQTTDNVGYLYGNPEAKVFYSREQRAERMSLHIHSATAARVEYPAAQLRYKFDAPSACCGIFD